MRHYPPKPIGTHTGWTPNRDRAAQHRFRQALMRRSGGTCEIPGCRTPFDRLAAHHDQPGYTADCGRLLCWHHHKNEDPHAR